MTTRTVLIAIALIVSACAPELNREDKPSFCTFDGMPYALYDSGELSVVAPYSIQSLSVDGNPVEVTGYNGAVTVESAVPSQIELNGEVYQAVCQ